METKYCKPKHVHAMMEEALRDLDTALDKHNQEGGEDA